jgi:flagellar protein FlaI
MSGDGGEAAGDTDTPGALGRLGRRVRRTWELLRWTPVRPRPFRPGEDGPLASFVPPDGEREIERYWVNAPFAYVVITYDDARNKHRYHAVEPALDGFQRDLLARVLRDIRDPLLYREGESGARSGSGSGPGTAGDGSDPDAEGTLRTELAALLSDYGVDADMATFHALLYYLYRDFRGYGKIDPLLHDDHIEDVSCDGYDLPVFAYHNQYADIETDVSFGVGELDSYVVRLAQQSGRHISVGDPLVETTLPDGSRAEISLGEEITPRGSAFTIRQYAEEPFTPIDLIDYGTYSVAAMAYFWLCIEHNKSLLFAGGTASGKTTSMNAVSVFVPPRAKVLTIEDTRELSLHHENWLSSVTREGRNEGADIDMFDLLRSALRHRPEYIIVGEVRGDEAVTLFQAMNTGHTTFSTMHADSVGTVINRLENEPIGVPRAMVQSLDVVSVQTQVRQDGERVRRARAINEIRGIDNRTGELDYTTSFTWDSDTDAFTETDSNVLGEIADEQGWSRPELIEERRRRERFLELLRDAGVTDFREFTALVNEYHAGPEAALDRLEGAARGGSRDDGVPGETVRVDGGRGDGPTGGDGSA